MRQPLRALAVATASLSLAGGAIAAATTVSANPAPQVVIPVSATPTHDSGGHDANDDHGGLRSSSSPSMSSGRDGSDDAAGHDANDDNSPRVTPNATESHRHGADDPAGHDAGDDHGGSNSGRH
jgi:merozoite surface protein 4